MLRREDWMMIKQMKDKGCYLQEIAAEAGVSEKTISRALKRGGAPAKRKAGVRASKLDPYKAEIDRLLGEQVWNAVVILSHIQALGYAGRGSILRDYIRPKRALRRRQATVRFETAPGAQLQHDWGELRVWLGGEERKVYIAGNDLSGVIDNPLQYLVGTVQAIPYRRQCWLTVIADTHDNGLGLNVVNIYSSP